jgi:serine phosphatase RsbU (regulator of sigma subunit)
MSFLKKSSAIARQRAKIIFFGAAIAFPVPLILLVLANLGITIGDIRILDNFMVFPIMIFPAFIAYSIARHNLFDVDVFIKRTVGYVIMTALVGAVYFALQVILGNYILIPLIGENTQKVYPILFALFVVFLFNPINKRVQGIIDTLFYRKKFDYKDTVLSLSNALTTVFNVDEIIKQIIHSLRQEMFIDRAGVILMNPQSECKALFVSGENHSDTQTAEQCLLMDDPLLTLMTKEKKMITRYDIQEASEYGEVKDDCDRRFEEIGATLALPFIYKGELTGVLALGQKMSGHFFSRDDIQLLETLSNQGAVAIENAKLFEENLEKGRMEEELQIAHELQTSMLPDKAPVIEGYAIAASSVSAREVGGDFYDFIEMPGDSANNNLGIVVGDVSGKAVSGALVMAASRSVFRVLSETNASVKDIMSIGNSRLKKDVKKGMFVALVYAVLDPDQKSLTLSNAGQTQPIICSGDAPAYIETDGDRFPLGIVAKCDYQEKKVQLKKGDTVVFYTDGVVEAMNDREEMFGFERFLTAINKTKDLDAHAMLEKLFDYITSFTGNADQHDDITIVIVKVDE